MKILLDVMSGDNAPLEQLKGASAASMIYDANISIVGNPDVILKTAKENNIDISKLQIIESSSVISMEDNALSVVKDKKDSSMAVGLRSLAESGEYDAFISSGNTGALLAGATLIVKRIKGIQRAGIATIIPLNNPVLLMDCGANLEVNPMNLEQFGYMGSCYMKNVLRIENPRVGLLNNGSESTKGTEILREAYQQMSYSDLNFVGNIEGKEIPFDAVDVLVTDGFTGNILLKFSEGMGKFMMGILKSTLTSNVATKIGAFTIKNKLDDMKTKFSSSTYGGAPLLGISKPVIKAHGSSKKKDIVGAIGQAIQFANTGINREIALYAINYQENLQERLKRAKQEQKTQAKLEKQARKEKRAQDKES